MGRATTPAPERRRGGRAARTAERAAPIAQTGQPRRRIPTYELLGDADLDALEAHADWILEEIGVEFRGDPEALELFRAAGSSVDGERVRFEPGLARHLCATAPSEFRMYGRDARHDVTIGGDHVVFSPAYGPPFVTDLDQGRRYATLADFENFVKLTYASPWLHHSGGTICEPVDVPVNKRHLDMAYAHLRWSTKPLMGSVTAPERAEDSLAMARLVFGADRLERDCVIQGNINVNSPLVFDDVMSGALKVYARANQGCVISPFIIGGAMGPVTQPALIAQAHAEALVGIALSQLVRPGSPMVYGNFLTTMDLKTGAPTFGTPEADLATYAIAQLARRVGLPVRCGGHYTASKTTDARPRHRRERPRRRRLPRGRARQRLPRHRPHARQLRVRQPPRPAARHLLVRAVDRGRRPRHGPARQPPVEADAGRLRATAHRPVRRRRPAGLRGRPEGVDGGRLVLTPRPDRPTRHETRTTT